MVGQSDQDDVLAQTKINDQESLSRASRSRLATREDRRRAKGRPGERGASDPIFPVSSY